MSKGIYATIVVALSVLGCGKAEYDRRLEESIARLPAQRGQDRQESNEGEGNNNNLPTSTTMSAEDAYDFFLGKGCHFSETGRGGKRDELFNPSKKYDFSVSVERMSAADFVHLQALDQYIVTIGLFGKNKHLTRGCRRLPG